MDSTSVGRAGTISVNNGQFVLFTLSVSTSAEFTKCIPTTSLKVVVYPVSAMVTPIAENMVVAQTEPVFNFDLVEMQMALDSEEIPIPDEIENFDFFENWLEQFK